MPAKVIPRFCLAPPDQMPGERDFSIQEAPIKLGAQNVSGIMKSKSDYRSMNRAAPLLRPGSGAQDMVSVFPAKTKLHFQLIRELISEYVAFDISQTRDLGLDPTVLLDFQYNQSEEVLPGDYGPPGGCLLFATVEG